MRGALIFKPFSSLARDRSSHLCARLSQNSRSFFLVAISALALQHVASFWRKSLVFIETPNKSAPFGAPLTDEQRHLFQSVPRIVWVKTNGTGFAALPVPSATSIKQSCGPNEGEGLGLSGPLARPGMQFGRAINKAGPARVVPFIEQTKATLRGMSDISRFSRSCSACRYSAIH